MAKTMNDNFGIKAPKPIDARYLDNMSAWASVAAVNSAISKTERYPGLTVLIGTTEYWYKDGVEDNNLIAKESTQVQSDWDEEDSSSPAYIQDKPTIPEDIGDLTDTGGIIPTDVSDLSDTNDIIPTDINQLADEDDLLDSSTQNDVMSMFDMGGIKEGETIAGGTTITAFITKLLQDVFQPTYIAPTYSLASNQSNGQEIGKTVNVLLTFNYNRGSIMGDMDGTLWNPNKKQADRGGAATKYVLNGVDKGTTNTHTVSSHKLLATQTFSGTLTYSEGPQPKDSKGEDFETPLAGGTNTKSTTITALYPYFWGKTNAASKPTKNQGLINSGTKVVANSNGTVTINFNSDSSDWIWFAIPSSSTSKSKWYVDELNNGNIGGEANLFDTENIVNVDSPDAYWNGVGYKIYVSNYKSSATTPMELRN